MSETIEIRRKRLKIRAWRRGIKEMDLLIGGYADAHLASMNEAELDEFEMLMDEHDQDLLSYATGLKPVPEAIKPMLEKLIADADQASWGVKG
ncbi:MULTISPECIES: succinate dehydrogenase assembly factor 2 [Celeribacter]|jgi:antitoxin CptB|uniref:Succinate dehydrogenase assembly factor 2 n=1 Tax=Celeribacter halophilus TaxID=576117 RepID=A0AAW7XT32_9RHOB|nr:succinate dehydrogenase assembly factor 2 [Celeribacter halophilus]MBU2889160.1 succinate dehydrogenase assembly factor 2 [Celeribacter halophilus]MDO6456247.1 succinate dehydrogenase assembly factor 2 [Celeribacter halophilus]MDO6510313.1 succinate dehydrogenase assembly factor 2 [Celeribacter halophilus]MDO6722738.1 succinate dehydrogenase assembly factor 2 [Celeribacter halophilus]